MSIRALIVVLFALSLFPAIAEQQAGALETEALSELKKYRCLVCQNQSIADSDAPLAKQMRAMVVAEIASGTTEDALAQKLKNQFGEYILYDPPFSQHTALLWIAPLLFLLAGVIFIIPSIKRKKENG